MASAQVKSCVLLAGLVTDATTVVEPVPTRDHTERMLLRAGATVQPRAAAGGGVRTTIGNVDELEIAEIEVPGDPSSAAFLIAAGVLVPGSQPAARARRRPTGRGPGSCGSSSGWGRSCSADIEPVGAFDAERAGRRPRRPSAGRCEATTVEADEVPLAIDELPLVALLGCFAEGETVVRGAAELRVKESDRIATVVDGLRGLGADIEARPTGSRCGAAEGCAAA